MSTQAVDIDRPVGERHRLSRPRVLVASGSPGFRHAFSRQVSLLGVNATCVSRFEALQQALRDEEAALLLIDGDGWERPWNELVRELDLPARAACAWLLVSSLDAGQAMEASWLGLDTVILKPFRPERHMSQLYDQLLAQRGVRPRREHPRYVPPADGALRLEVLPAGDWVIVRLPVLDVSAGGARLRLPGLPGDEWATPGSRLPIASMLVGPARAGAVLRVVHRHRGTLGVAFERLEDWGGILADVLQGFAGNAFGAVVPPRPW